MPDQPPKIVGVLEGVFHDINSSAGMGSRLACERIQHDATAGSREPSVALSSYEPDRARLAFSHQAAAMARHNPYPSVV